MAFENMTTWLVSFGYIFVIVIAGSALFVGATKKKNRKKKLEEESRKAQISNQNVIKPETEIPEVVNEETKQESDKTE
jgi:hypothetical protein